MKRHDHGKEALYLEDVVEVLGADRRNVAEEAFAALDNDPMFNEQWENDMFDFNMDAKLGN